ncbi:hypothetical protein HPP92_000178 [Vanilla planifolia]|uniref:Transmembrane protein n=1 Tax=Vanilla planifolia TaxID=51239 RepID=A0A835VE59_VANPL|nr:hypothetical protein HPP92_000178 [Vanilla planifolia]
MELSLEQHMPAADPYGDVAAVNSAHGWQKVTYAKRQRRQNQAVIVTDFDHGPGVPQQERSSVFASVEKKAYERRRAIESAAAAAVASTGSAATVDGASSDGEGDHSGPESGKGEGTGSGEIGEKKVKQKKPKKPKVTVVDAAAKIDAVDLAAFLADVSASYESKQDIQLMRFADYFGRAFSAVSASQFPWTKMFKDSALSKIVDVPISHIQNPVYKTSVDWIAQKSPDSLGDFVLWCIDAILADLESQQVTSKASKKTNQQSPLKCQVAVFVVLALTLRRKPDVLINLLPKLGDNPEYKGQQSFPVLVWVVAQAAQADLLAGMHAWAHFLLPLICGKSGNPQTRGLALQLVERILSQTKASSILLNGAVRKGERLVPPSSFDLLIRLAFPLPSARVKATERFEEVYPSLKKLALAGSPGAKSTKQAAQQILTHAMKAMQENNPALTNEAANIFIWCLAQNQDCYKQWEKVYMDNLGASVSVIRKLSNEWKEQSAQLSPLGLLRETIENFRAMNEKSLSLASHSGDKEAIEEADKHCKALLKRLKRSSICLKSGVLVAILAVLLAFVLSPNTELFDREKLHALLSSFKSFVPVQRI